MIARSSFDVQFIIDLGYALHTARQFFGLGTIVRIGNLSRQCHHAIGYRHVNIGGRP